jgi:TraB/PrgY/gumN family
MTFAGKDIQKLFGLALTLILSLGSRAMAQDAADAPVPETVLVHAAPGPAVWHLTRGNSEVWILGTVGAMPKGLEWNHDYLSQLLDGARAILMPPRPDVGIFDGAWFLITNGSKLSLPRGQALEASLPDALRTRFIATRTALGRDEERYRTDTPIRAALRLEGDFQDKAALSGREPAATIADLASAHRVPISPVSRFEVLDALKQVLDLSFDQQRVCLSQAVADVDQQSGHAAIAARAWAIGDIKTVKANYTESQLFNCISAAAQSAADINERIVLDYTAAINAALDKPGKTVVAIGIGPLLRRGGVLERLQALHIAMESPPGS